MVGHGIPLWVTSHLTNINLSPIAVREVDREEEEKMKTKKETTLPSGLEAFLEADPGNMNLWKKMGIRM